jgi:hypothetical protein
MTPGQLRAWLNNCVDWEISTQPGYTNVQSTFAPDQPSNTSAERYIPITVGPANAGAGVPLLIANSTMTAKNAVYLPDLENQCPRVNATAHNIVISGQFTGCRFIKCTDGAGQLHVGHIYANLNTPNNLPVAQAQAFKAAVGAVGHHSDGFLTRDRVQPPATSGYVFGTFHLGVWHWHWLTVRRPRVGNAIVHQCIDITGANHWVPL